MAGDSAFRRLLLDTVATAIAQPPSSSSLIELLRIATPRLLQQPEEIRDATKRDKFFRTLQLRIHPDKHDDERATVLFQDTTLFYAQCVNAMEREDEQKRRSGEHNSSGIGTATNDSQLDGATNFGNNRSNNANNRSRTAASAHSDYENADNDDQSPQDLNSRHRKSSHHRGRQPSSHQAFAIVSTLLFPPLGLCALFHSFKVRRAWNDSRYGDARHHSDQAYSYAWFSCLCFAALILYIWLSDGDVDWDWDRVKRNFSWDDGP